MEPISSTRNRAVVEAGRLHRARDRRRTGLTLLEGPNPVREAIAAGISLERIFALDGDPLLLAGPPATPVTAAVLEKLAGTASPQGPVAIMAIPADQPPRDDQSVIVLWGVGDPGNVGTIIRSCAAFDVAVAIGPESADAWSPKVLRAGAGGHFRTPIVTLDTLTPLAPRPVVATRLDGSATPKDLPAGPLAVLIGAESSGLPSDLMAVADIGLTIPMPGGSESLNASVAASIIAYELAGRSSGAGPSGTSD